MTKATWLAWMMLLLSTAGAAPPSPDADYDALHRDFSNLYDSLRATGGYSVADRPVIDDLRKRAAAYEARHRDDPRGVALELQLALWLDDKDAINDLYGKLAALSKDIKVGLGWVQHFQAASDRKRVGEIYPRLAKLFPDDAGIRIGWARFYREANLYARTLEVLDEGKLDPATQPEAAVLRSDCLFAEARYPEAVAALESIPPETLSANDPLRQKVEGLLTQRRDYPALWDQEQQIRAMEAKAKNLPRVQIETPEGRIVVELFENEAPNTVANFIALSESGFYDGTSFHRIVNNSMIEGGDPNTRSGATGTAGTGGPGYRIEDEHGREDARKHFAGSVGMANSGSPHSAGSRFYITFLPAPELNGRHTVFGRVVDGLDLVRSLEAGDAVESITVQRKRDHEYKPQTLADPVPTLPAPPPPPPPEAPNPG